MQARRFWNLLKLLRIDGEEPDLEIQCQILQIKKQDLITFMRDEEKNVPQEWIDKIMREYKLSYSELKAYTRNAAQMEWAEQFPQQKTASGVIIRELCGEGHSLEDISDATYIPIEYLKKMSSGEEPEVESFFHNVKKTFNYSSEKIERYKKYFSRNVIKIKARGLNLNQRSLIWLLNYMLPWLNEDGCNNIKSMLSDVKPVKFAKNTRKKLDISLYRYIKALADERSMETENIFANTEIWSISSLNGLMRKQHNLSSEQIESLQRYLHLNYIEKECLRYLNGLYESYFVIRLSAENSTTAQYELLYDFQEKVSGIDDDTCSQVKDYLLDLRYNMEYCIARDNSVMDRLAAPLSPVFSFLVSKYGYDAASPLRMETFLNRSSSTCYAIKNGQRAFTSDILQQYIDHYRMDAIDQELFRYFAFINERYSIVDLNNYSIRPRAVLNEFNQMFSFMTESDFQELDGLFSKIRNRLKIGADGPIAPEGNQVTDE